MRSLYVFGLICSLALIMTGCETQTSQQGQLKICVVDMGKLMKDSLPGKEGVKIIESFQVQMQKDLDAIQEKLEKNPQDAAAMQELQLTYSQAQQRLQAEGQNVANQIMEIVDSQVNKYRENNNYDMILASDAMYSWNPALDKTAEILALIDKQKVEFKPLPQQPAQAAPVQDNGNSEAVGQSAPQPESAKAEPAAKQEAEQGSKK